MLFLFFKQKTAYEMRISDWSSDVCSSDLEHRQRVADRPYQDAGDPEPQTEPQRRRQGAVHDGDGPRRAGEPDRLGERAVQRPLESFDIRDHVTSAQPPKGKKARKRTEDGRLRKGGVRTGRYRVGREH